MALLQDFGFALLETWEIDLQCVDPDGKPVSLDGGAVEFRLATSTALALDLRLTAGDSGFATGKARMIIAPADQAALAAGLFQYETRAVLATGEVYDQLYGSILARPSLFKTFPYTPPTGGSPTPGKLAYDTPVRSGLITVL
jgi:hypothetical protein